MRRPALLVAGAALGSSMVRAIFVECVETVVEIVVANAVGRPSGVTNNDFARARSLSRILWKSKTLSPGILQASHSLYHFFFPDGIAYQGDVFEVFEFFERLEISKLGNVVVCQD